MCIRDSSTRPTKKKDRTGKKNRQAYNNRQIAERLTSEIFARAQQVLGSQPDLLGACPADESGSDSETGPEERVEGNDLKRGKVPPSYIQFHENLVTTSRDIYRDACVVAQEIRELVKVRVDWRTGDDPTGLIARKDFPLKEIGPMNSKLEYLNKQLE